MQTDLTDDYVVVCAESFTEDICTTSVCPAQGLFRDVSQYEGRPQGVYYNHIVLSDDDVIVADGVLSAVDDSVADIGCVTSDIFGNEIAMQKRTAGAHS